MAKVLEPFGSTKAHGSVGGMTAARGGSGDYVKKKDSRAQPRTAAQQKTRAVMQEVTRGYQDLSKEQIDEWVEFGSNWPQSGKCGDVVNLTGANWFTRLNFHRVGAGLDPISRPPVGPGCEYLPTVTFTQTAAGIVVDADPRPVGEELIYLSRCAPCPLSRSFLPESRTFVAYLRATSQWPYLVWRNLDLGLEQARYFFVWRCIDGSGRHTPEQSHYVAAKRGAIEWREDVATDTYLKLTVPDNNYGGHANLWVYGAVAAEMHSVLRWDVSAIPSSAIVDSAEIHLFCEFGVQSGWIGVYEGLTQWLEMQATWNVRKTGVPWGVPGGQADVDYDGAPEDMIWVEYHSGWNTWRCTSMVQAWISGARTNFGLWLLAPGTANSAGFWSLDCGVVEKPPYMVVEYKTW